MIPVLVTAFDEATQTPESLSCPSAGSTPVDRGSVGVEAQAVCCPWSAAPRLVVSVHVRRPNRRLEEVPVVSFRRPCLCIGVKVIDQEEKQMGGRTRMTNPIVALNTLFKLKSSSLLGKVDVSDSTQHDSFQALPLYICPSSISYVLSIMS